MINSKSERVAIHIAAQIFSDSNWFFREQTVLDFGIDALAEPSENGRPSGRFLGFQIKGGSKSFYRTQNSLSYYFTDTHHKYWLTFAKQIPLFILLYDPISKVIFWQSISPDKITKTKKGWKIDVPLMNILNNDTCKYLEHFVSNYQSENISANNVSRSHLLRSEVESSLNMSFFLKRKKIWFSISDFSTSFSFCLEYQPPVTFWDKKHHELRYEDPFFFTLSDLKDFFYEKYSSNNSVLRSTIFNEIVSDIKDKLQESGINGLARFLFNNKNERNNIPDYSFFIRAFEKYSGLSADKYVAEAVDSKIHFRVDSREYEMDSYEGKIADLKLFIESKSYEEIFLMTDSNIWSEIYIDAGIKKDKFIPTMLYEWEVYWEKQTKRLSDIGASSNDLEKDKEKSWHQLMVFMECYNDAVDIIAFAYDLDFEIIYPLSVITMLNIFDAETCYSEYCEFEFFDNNEWEHIDIDDEKTYEGPTFFIRPYGN